MSTIHPSPVVHIDELTDGESGSVIESEGHNDKSVHVFGTFNGASVAIKGGNTSDSTKFATLKDLDGNDLTFTALGVNSIRDNTRFFQAVVTGGASAAITVAFFVR